MHHMMKSYKVIIPKTVEQDLAEILEYYSALNPEYALALLNTFKQRFSELKQLPERGRIVPELYIYNELRYRELIEQNWRIFYKVQNSEVLVLAVIDSRRNVQEILLRKLQRKINL